MATKILKDIRINSYRVVFGKIGDKYLIAMPESNLSGYLLPFTEENKHDNIILLTDIFKRQHFRDSVMAYLIITTIYNAWKGIEKE